MPQKINYLKKIKEIRDGIIDARRNVAPYEWQGTEYEHDLKALEGTLTLTISNLYYLQKRVRQWKIDKLKKELNEPVYDFTSRGIGQEFGLRCFVTGDDNDGYCMPNISGFVDSKENGEAICAFVPGSYLDYREHEPNYIQVKIGAHPDQIVKLRRLNDAILELGVIHKTMVEKIIGKET